MEKKTPLYEQHIKAGGKPVPFAGYLLPIQYEGVIAEHMAVRTAAGLFDVSHMGEILCRGKDALANLQHLLTNDFTNMADGRARYSPMCNEKGGIVDDLIVYKVHDEVYFIVVNAANRDRDFQWMKDHAFGEVSFEDISENVAQIALQGPKAPEIMKKLTPVEKIPTKYYQADFNSEVNGIPCLLSRTGYTGENGYEIYLAPDKAAEVWDLLLEAGKEEGLIPCGLGARDTLRLEAAMPLYGHEMNEEITPLEADLGFAVKLQKEEFIGKEGIEAHLPLTRTRVGIFATGRGIIREEAELFSGDTKVGVTTSGTHLPKLNRAAAMAIVDIAYAEPGTKLTAVVRGRKIEAEVTKLPFYKKEK